VLVLFCIVSSLPPFSKKININININIIQSKDKATFKRRRLKSASRTLPD